MSELIIQKGNKNLIVCFGGLMMQFAAIPPFEFLKYLSAAYTECDLFFYVDMHQCWYHKGLKGLTSNIDETVQYLSEKIITGGYETVVFMGTSAGGYAAILFGSLLCVKHVISFIPQTRLNNCVNPAYKDLKTVICPTTKYLLVGDANIKNVNDLHHVSHCDNLSGFDNVTVCKKSGVNMRLMRDTGVLKSMIDECFGENIMHS